MQTWFPGRSRPQNSRSGAGKLFITTALAALALGISACAPSSNDLPSPSFIPSEILDDHHAYEEASRLRLGQGVPRDYGAAVRTLRRLADGYNDTRAMNDLGIMEARGQGVEQSYRGAARWFIEAAGRNNSSARYNLAILHLHGAGVEQDINRAIHLLGEAAAQGNHRAQVQLAQIFDTYDHRSLGERARALYHRAAEGGQLDSWRQLANTAEGRWMIGLTREPRDVRGAISDALVDAYSPTMHGNDEFERSRVKREVRILRDKARQGDVLAQYNLGLRYMDGAAVPPDSAEAARWMTVSAESGYAPAQHRLGLMYLNGQGVFHNPVHAHQWLHLASVRGTVELREQASSSLEALEKQMDPNDINAAQSRARAWEPNTRLQPVW